MAVVPSSDALPPISSPTTSKDLQVQREMSERSEEYRQLFNLPVEEVLISDYNCALQENFLLQGHIYVFDHYICFYSNLFGYETKKVIPFHEVTAVRRAKAAGIFPTAIEIMAGEKKLFFTSFLSRDDAFKLIIEGWSQYGNGTKENSDLLRTKLEPHRQENVDVAIEKASSSKHKVDGADLSERQDISIFEDSKVPVEDDDDDDDEIVSSSGAQDIDDSVVTNTLSPGRNLGWAEENCDAPKISDMYTKVAESKFPISVEEFFSYFFSDDAVGFLESYHQTCGDKDFRCNSWYPHKEFGHAREVSFQHPIKFYLGAKCGRCEEVQKYRVYKNSHLVMETSQNVKDVPYGDYFHVEGLMDVERDCDDSRRSCTVRVYVNVIFTKKTIFKGKIMQATIDEARDAYAIWIKMAHELLKRKKLEKVEEEAEGEEAQTKLQALKKTELVGDMRPPPANDPNCVPSPGSINSATSFALFRETLLRFHTSLISRSQARLLLFIALAFVLLMMQLSIVVLLSKPQKVHLVPHLDYSSSLTEKKYEMTAWIEKRIQHFKEEMLIIESVMDKMNREHKLLKEHLEDLEHFKRIRIDKIDPL